MKILLVEDQVSFATVLMYGLEGLDIHHVETLAAARRWLDTNHVDMILLDLGLEDSHGIDTLRALKEYKIPKVVITGRFDISGDAYHEGASDYLVKMTPLPDIIERIMFNLAKIRPRKRFADNVFEELKTCFAQSRELFESRLLELTTA